MEKRHLSADAYGGVAGEDYKPYISVDSVLPELTGVAIILGIIFTALFSAANTYLGLKIGAGISVNIPVAILAMAYFKKVLKRNSVLESNLVQGMASVGEGMACGLIFAIPAVTIVGLKLNFITILVCGIIGGVAGVLFVIPIRHYLIVKEHGELAFPESTAIAEVLVSTENGGDGFKNMMAGVVVGSGFKLFTEGFAFFKSSAEWTITAFQSTIVGIDVLGSLVGIGFIVGLDAALFMLGGAFMAAFIFVPLIKYVGGAGVVLPGGIPISEMDAWAIRDNYVKYIGAGAVATGGIISVVTSMPTLIKSFKAAIKGIGKTSNGNRQETDLGIQWVLLGAVAFFVCVWMLPIMKVGLLGALATLVCAFFFSVVSARIVGILGNTNNPVSGMTISAVLIIASILKVTGRVGDGGMFAAVVACTVVCVSLSVAGDVSQSMKATYLIGGSPKKVELGMLAAAIVSTVVVGGVILLLDQQYGLGSDQISAPQATMVGMLVKGIMTNQLPWLFIFIGAALAITLTILKMPVLPIAIGIYLPMSLSTGIMIGAVIREIVNRKYANNKSVLDEKVERGVLVSSGLIAGDALLGIAFAALSIMGVNIAFGPKVLPEFITNNTVITVIAGVLYFVWMFRYITKKKK